MLQLPRALFVPSVVLLAACNRTSVKNILPTITTDPEQRVEAGDDVTLEATAEDEDGEPPVVTWTQLSGIPVDFDGTDTVQFTAPTVADTEVLVFEATATDDEGASASARATVIVTSTNQAPEVDAGTDQTVHTDVVVTLEGSASDSDGSIVATRWEQLTGPTLNISDPDQLTLAFEAPDTSATLLFELTATDDLGAQSSDLVTVEVVSEDVPVDPPPTAPTVDAGADQTVDAGASVDLGATASTTGTWMWTQLTGASLTLDPVDAADTSFVAPDVVVSTDLVFQVAFDDGNTTVTDDVVITVLPGNLPPEVDAGPDASVLPDAEVTLVGTASDPDGSIAAHQWTQTEGPTVALTGADTTSASFTAPTGANTLVFELEVTDDEGATAVDTVTITVDPGTPTNTPPLADPGGDQSVLEETTVFLEGSATDADGTVTGVQWVQVAGTPVPLTDDDTPTASFTAPTVTEPTALLFAFTATDDQGASDTGFASVQVLPVNLAPTVDAGPDSDVTPDSTAALIGTASDDDGIIASTTWRQIAGPTVVISDPTALSTDFTAPDTTVTTPLTFELEAIDDEGSVTTDTVTLTVRTAVASNAPPEVDAGGDGETFAGSTTALTGSATDSDGSIVSTVWTQVSGPAVDIDDPSSPFTTFAAPSVDCSDVVVFALTATDDLGATATDEVAFAVYNAGGVAVSTPIHWDLEVDDGDLVGTGDWAWGSITSGPDSSWDGANAWATNPAGNYSGNQDAHLCLPPVDRGGDPATLSARFYMYAQSNDISSLEVLDPTQGWVLLDDVEPEYDVTSGMRGWNKVGFAPAYTLLTARIPPTIPDPVRLRFRLQTNAASTQAGAYLDEIRVDLEASDPDGDGLVGIRTELEAYGSDPFVADTDGDGVADDAEFGDGTDPIDPSSFIGDVQVGVPWFSDAEGDDGLVGVGNWERAVPDFGVDGAFSGSQSWLTNASGHYGNHQRNALYLPDLDLSGSTAPTLSFRYWMQIRDDAASVQIFDETLGWTTLTPAFPTYNDTDTEGFGGWDMDSRGSFYELAAFPLEDWAGETVRVRITLNTNLTQVDPGLSLDDFALDDEFDDPDGDGLPGVIDEYTLFGTDPYRADTDGDGVDDGDEVNDGTDPLNPADYVGAALLVPGSHLDFSGGPDGCASEGEAWEWGSVTGGPGASHDGGNAWSTRLAGAYAANRRSGLYLPVADLTGTTDPTLSLRLWSEFGNDDGFSLQVFDGTGWTTIDPSHLDYDDVSFDNNVWRNHRDDDNYQLATFDLSPWEGQLLPMRLYATTNAIVTAEGAYVDEIRLDEESADPDGDGVIGVRAEADLGLDPYMDDTDGDGVLDGAELTAGTDPTNPADHSGAPVWTVGSAADLTGDAGGLATTGDLWEYGAVGNGPGSGYDGVRAWGTDLDANYNARRDEALYFPLIDLSGAVAPSLSFQAWIDIRNDDGVQLEIDDPVLGWTPLTTVPAYDDSSPYGPAWSSPHDGWQVAGAHLDAFAGQTIALRLRFGSNALIQRAGMFIDHIRVLEESSDPDGDGLIGILDERGIQGTDPFLADTDGDGVDDPTELGAGTDPLDPASN